MGNIKYFAYVKDDVLSNGGACPLIAEGLYNVEISEEIYNNLDHYMAVKHEEEIDVPDYDQETDEQTGTHKETVITYTIELNPNYDTEQLALLRQAKNTENDNKANVTLPKVFKIKVGQKQTECHFIYNKDTQDDLNSAAIGFLAGTIEQKQWTDEQGITVQLSAEDVQTIFMTFRSVVDAIWEKWGNYKQAINSAKNLAELKKIKIDYSEFINKEGEN